MSDSKSFFACSRKTGSRVSRSETAGESAIFVPIEGDGEVPIFEVPGELLVQLAQAGRYRLRLVGVEDVPKVR